MKVCYYPDTDTVYIELADRVSSSSETVGDFIVDFDDGGKPVGVTFEHYSKARDACALEALLRSAREAGGNLG